jgi:saccharopine dehydrogenase (NADP+, L-glutamate forming)
MKNIAIIGAGLMVKPIVDYFLNKNEYTVTLADREIDKAIKIKAGREKCIALEWSNNDKKQLDNIVEASDVVISMVPKPIHIFIVRSCLKFKKNMVTAAYEVPEILELKDEIEKSGILILNELGEVPGMDHFGTQLVLDQIKEDGGHVVSLNSYGSGIPAFESNNNPMGYKFSWDPRTVFVAAQTAAAYMEKGKKISIPGDKLFENFSFIEIKDLGTFETYPNKNVEKYIKPFGLDRNASFYRGLLRYSGYCNNMRYLGALDLFKNETSQQLSNKTYQEFTASLINSTSIENLEKQVADYLNIDFNSDIIHRIKWLGLFDTKTIPLTEGTNLDVLLDLMLKKMKYEDNEKDMIILHIEAIAEFENSRKEKRTATMVVKGIPYGETAMSRAVGLPTAIAARLIVDEKVKGTGLKIPPTLPELYKPALEELKEYGFEFTTKTETIE